MSVCAPPSDLPVVSKANAPGGAERAIFKFFHTVLRLWTQRVISNAGVGVCVLRYDFVNPGRRTCVNSNYV